MKTFRVHTTTGHKDVRAEDAKAARDMVKAPGIFIKKVKRVKE